MGRWRHAARRSQFVGPAPHLPGCALPLTPRTLTETVLIFQTKINWPGGGGRNQKGKSVLVPRAEHILSPQAAEYYYYG